MIRERVILFNNLLFFKRDPEFHQVSILPTVQRTVSPAKTNGASTTLSMQKLILFFHALLQPCGGAGVCVVGSMLISNLQFHFNMSDTEVVVMVYHT